MLNGLFAFIWQMRNSAPNAQALVARMQQVGFQTGIVKVVDGKDSYPLKQQDEPFVQECIAALRAANIGVWGWGAYYGKHPNPAKNFAPEDQAQKTVERILQLNLPGFALDVENFSGSRWSPELANRFMATLLAGLQGHPVELALCSYRFPHLHGSFPLAEFAAGCSLMMPQLYWIQSQPVADLIESIKQYQALAPGKPYLPLGTAAPSDDGAWRPTPGQITAFLDESRARNLPAYGFWTLQHAFADKALWQTLVDDHQQHAGAVGLTARRRPRSRRRNFSPTSASRDTAPMIALMSGEVEPLDAMGTITAKKLKYRDAPSTTTGVPRGELSKNDRVKVTGRQTTDDPDNPLWYRVDIDGSAFWMSAVFIDLDSAPLDPSGDPLLIRLSKHVALAAGTQLSNEQLQALVDMLEQSNLWLRGQWMQSDLEEALGYLTALKEYGFSLDVGEQTRANGWAFDEVRLVHNAVMAMARHAHQSFAAAYPNQIRADEQAFCFRTLYAPSKLTRVNLDNLNVEHPDKQWWAVNANGFSIRFGNRVFTQTNQTIHTSAGDFPKFTPTELIMHEIGHTIGWRRPLSSSTAAFDFDDGLSTHRFADGTSVTLVGDAGLLPRPGSSSDKTEVIADLLVSDALQKFTVNTPGSGLVFSEQENRQGRARAEQAPAIMRQVIQFRVSQFRIDHSGAGPQPALQFLQTFADADTARCAELASAPVGASPALHMAAGHPLTAAAGLNPPEMPQAFNGHYELDTDAQIWRGAWKWMRGGSGSKRWLKLIAAPDAPYSTPQMRTDAHSRDAVDAAVAYLAPETTKRYAAIHDENGNVTTTFCNIFVNDATRVLYCEIPNNPASSNVGSMLGWMEQNGAAAGWAKTQDGQQAQNHVNSGHVAIMILSTGQHSDHVALVRPGEGMAQEGAFWPRVAQAGGVVGSDIDSHSTFGHVWKQNKLALAFYLHE